jgi:hypothetical protein
VRGGGTVVGLGEFLEDGLEASGGQVLDCTHNRQGMSGFVMIDGKGRRRRRKKNVRKVR